MSRVTNSPEWVEFINLTGSISVALVQLADVQVGGRKIDHITEVVDREIMEGNMSLLRESKKLNVVQKQRDMATYQGLRVLKLLFEKGLELLTKLTEMAETNVPN